MGINERKAKEKEELKNLILQGASKLFAEKGIEHTTIRNIADEISYSVGTIYVYFKDKNEILHALHTEGFKRLRGQMSPLLSTPNPVEKLKDIGNIYINFALKNQEMYDLMFIMKAPLEFVNEVHNEEWNEGRATFEFLLTTVKQCIAEGYFRGHNPEALSFMIWGTVHGICSLTIRDRTKGIYLEQPEAILQNSYNEFSKIIDKL